MSVATFLELRKDPRTGANAVEIMTPNLVATTGIAQRLPLLPQVSQTVTLNTLIPSDQDVKLELIRKAASALGPSLNPAAIKPPPTDQENVTALSSTAAALSAAAGEGQGSGASAARRLAGLLSQLAVADPSLRKKFETA